MQNLSSVVEVNKYVYTRGCVEAMSELFERNMNLVAIICLGSALAQVDFLFLLTFDPSFFSFTVICHVSCSITAGTDFRSTSPVDVILFVF